MRPILPASAPRTGAALPTVLIGLGLAAALAVTAAFTWSALTRGGGTGRPWSGPVTGLAAGALGGASGTAARVVLTAAGVAAVAAVGALLARDPPPGLPLPRVTGMLAAGAVLVATGLRERPGAAVVGLCCVALVLAEFLAPGRRRPLPGGVALGLAVALQPALVLFAVLLAVGRARRRALRAVALALALDAAAWAARPAASARGWRRVADSVAVAGPDSRSVPGLLAQLHLHGVPLLLVWAAAGTAVCVLALRRGSLLAADLQRPLALGVAGCAVAFAAPRAGADASAWLLLAAVGRVGRRPEDRALWPVVAATVALLPPSLLDPTIEPVSGLLLRNAPALTAAAAAAVLPFRRTGDPLWSVRRRPGPTPAHPFGRSYLPLLPAGLRPVSRPNPLLELLFVQVGYGVYSWIRNAAPDRAAVAVGHARQVLRAEELLHLDAERLLNGWALREPAVLDLSLFFYKSFHLIVPMLVLVWLYLWRPGRYRTSRTVLFTATGLALAGFWAYPLAPPRLTPGLGLRDSPAGTVATAPLGALTELTNQYAAMPSLHIAWALWCALCVSAATRRRGLGGLAWLYPAATLFAVVASANHWVLDAVGGAAVVAVGCLVQYVLTGRRLLDRSAGLPPGTVLPQQQVAGGAERGSPPRGA
ncbi:hypothetical protein KNE206_57890 [Kitasatospora sp. NE20-6]|uniref:phosphatase PAP2 family protein n=1 Tax=Kitasatospora sp. NE20-6 TaxID=2859066 RepID=UPI0034DC7ADF